MMGDARRFSFSRSMPGCCRGAKIYAEIAGMAHHDAYQ